MTYDLEETVQAVSLDITPPSSVSAPQERPSLDIGYYIASGAFISGFSIAALAAGAAAAYGTEGNLDFTLGTVVLGVCLGVYGVVLQDRYLN